jgi:hypothetical protein
MTDRQALLSTLTTEHFTLQGARASVVGEMGARSSLYLSAVSSALIALGFVAQVSKIGQTFRLFARVQLVFTSASTIAIVNSVVAGGGTALLIGAATSAAPALAVACGAAATVALAIGHLLHERRSFTQAFASMEVLFPSRAGD